MEPKLRFKEFNGDWEEKKIRDICKMFSGGTPTSGNREYYGGNINFIRSGEIHLNNTELTLTQLGLDSSSAKLVEIGDILYALYGATSGEVDISKINGAINQAILCIRPNKHYCRKYLVEILNFNKINILNKYLQGGQGNLSAEIIKNLKFKFPLLPEQTKIADFLSTVDEKIQNQQDKITHLENIKKGFMQKIFSRKIRFKDANGNEFPEWEEKKIGEITKFHKQGYYTKDKYVDNGVKLARVSDLFCPNICYENMPQIVMSNKDYEDFKLCNGDFLFARSGGIGRYGIVKNIDERVVFGSFLIKFIFDKEILLNEFMGYFYTTKIVESQLTKITQTSANININAENIKKIKIGVPCLEEQQKIADFLSSFDEKIDAEKETLEHLKELKKGLLQQMFI